MVHGEDHNILRIDMIFLSSSYSDICYVHFTGFVGEFGFEE